MSMIMLNARVATWATLIPRFSHEAQSAYYQIQKQIINTYMYM